MVKILFLFSFASIFSCQVLTDEINSKSDKIEVKSIEPEIIKESSVHKPGVFISVADTFLVMVRQNEPMVRIYSTNSNKLLGEFGRKGGGRNDFEAPSLINFPSGHSSDKPMVATYDWLKGRVTYIDLLSYFNGSDDFLFHYNFPVQLFGGLPGGFYTAHEKFMFVGHNSYDNKEFTNRFAVLNLETGKRELVPLIPKLDFPVHKSIEEMAYRSFVAYNEEKGLIAAIPNFLGRIDFFNEELDYQFSSVYRSNNENSISLTSGKVEKDGRMVNSLSDFNGSVSNFSYSKDYLFIQCIESNYGDALQGANSKIYLRIFSWEGEQLAVSEYKTSFNSVIAYDYIHNRLYAYDSSKDLDNLMMFDLPTF